MIFQILENFVWQFSAKQVKSVGLTKYLYLNVTIVLLNQAKNLHNSLNVFANLNVCNGLQKSVLTLGSPA